ncbi:MAG: molecular chaperone HtpG, partial [Polyangiaceae bacterium]|nr:molecular chaperone HtpG [Polyangiaceae bacterium]
ERPDDYAVFWRAFGPMVKQGAGAELEHRERVAKLLRYETTHGEAMTSLTDYVGRMKEGQPAIYYAIGESRRALEGAPHLEGLRKRGYEVLLMTEPIDEWAVESLHTFDGKPLVSAMRADLKIEPKEEEKEAREAEAGALKPLLERFRSVLGARVSEVRTTDRLTDSPVCLVLAGGGPHAYVERLLREAGREVPQSKRILEVNPEHAVVRNLAAYVTGDPTPGDDARVAEWIELLYDQALVTEGAPLADPAAFARRLTALLTAASGSRLQAG